MQISLNRIAQTLGHANCTNTSLVSRLVVSNDLLWQQPSVSCSQMDTGEGTINGRGHTRDILLVFDASALGHGLVGLVSRTAAFIFGLVD